MTNTDIKSIRQSLIDKNIFYANDTIMNQTSIIGYEKMFKWKWFATQLNTFVVISDFKNTEITADILNNHLKESFSYAKKNNKGWIRGVQSGYGNISIILSDKVSEEAKVICEELKVKKKWSAFSIPVIVDKNTEEIFMFEKQPYWGKLYFPYFKSLINEILIAI